MILPIPACLIWGDSIAAGLATRYPACVSVAKVGAPTSEIARWPLPRYRGVTVVSAGSNDPESPTIGRDMYAIRARIAGPVIWVVPRSMSGAMATLAACRPGDRAAFLSSVPSKDGIHPVSYARLAVAVDRAAPCR